MIDFIEFESLIDLLDRFNTDQVCFDYLAQLRWGDKPVCPHCNNSERIYQFKDGRNYKCSSCRKKFTVKVGTVFEGSNISLRKWFAAIYLFTSHKKGISSVQLSKDIKVTQKTAWYMLHRLRYAMEHPDYKKPLDGTIEADETYVGGKEKNRHLSKRNFNKAQGSIGRSGDDKTVVFGAVQREGDVKGFVVDNAKKESLQPIIIKNVKEFSRVITDEWYAYNQLHELGFNHSTIKHSIKKYVEGDVHTNTIENFWSCLKRGLYGIYHWASKKHLQRYIEEFCYRYNHRHLSEAHRFGLLLKQSDNGKLPYATLIKKGG
jgi:transposase-like protein